MRPRPPVAGTLNCASSPRQEEELERERRVVRPMRPESMVSYPALSNTNLKSVGKKRPTRSDA